MFARKYPLMKRRFLAAVLAVLPGVGVWEASVHAQQTGAVSQASPNPIRIKSRVFHLPIRIDRASLPKVREVCLYMKEGQGEWIRRDSVSPTTESFRCVVPHDGEFSFAVVTIDNLGNSYPADISSAVAAMTVVVESGQPRETIVVSDPTPLPVSTTESSPPPPTGGVSSVASGPVVVNGTGSGSSSIAKAVSQPIQSGPQTIQVTPPPAPATPPAPVAAAPATQPLPPPNAPVAPSVAAAPTPTTQAVAQPTPPAPPVQPTTPPATVQTTHTVSQPATLTNASTPSTPSTTTATGSRQVLNTTRVGIDYNVGRVGPSGLSKVEVWATQDQGRTWQRVGEDSDQRSPAEVDLPGEGVYGIRLVGVNGNGFGGKAPNAGDTPSSTIEVDMTNPTIHALDIDSVSKNGVLDIRYRVSDKNLTAEPINLFYAAQRTGPWMPIAFKAKNEGTYRWTLPRDVPSQLFFRIEACDVAGNIARTETPNPILLDMTEPDLNVIGISGRPQRVAGN